MLARCVGLLFFVMVSSPLLIGCVIAADAHPARRRIREAGKPFTDACGGLIRNGVFAFSETASVELGGFRDFRDGVKVRIVKAVMTLPRGENVTARTIPRSPALRPERAERERAVRLNRLRR